MAFNVRFFFMFKIFVLITSWSLVYTVFLAKLQSRPMLSKRPSSHVSRLVLRSTQLPVQRGTCCFPGVKLRRQGVDHPPPCTAEVKEIVELKIYSPSGSSWPVLEWNLPLNYDEHPKIEERGFTSAGNPDRTAWHYISVQSKATINIVLQ